MSSLPPWLQAALGQTRTGAHDLGAASSELSQRYRAGGGSRAAMERDGALDAYLVSRMPATYAAVREALHRLLEQCPDFAPRTLLDVGAGPGTASIAVAELFDTLHHAALLDHTPAFRAVASRLLAASPHPVLSAATILEGDAATEEMPLPRADLVVASYLLAELPERARVALIPKLWAAASDVLLLIEPGTPDGFARVRSARAALIHAGATVLAPCTHDLACPIAGMDWCHFSVRLPRSRAHMRAKSASVPWEDERFSYVAVSRQPRLRNTGRIVAPVVESKAGLGLRVCADGLIAGHTVARRDKEAYAAHRRLRWGDLV